MKKIIVYCIYTCIILSCFTAWAENKETPLDSFMNLNPSSQSSSLQINSYKETLSPYLQQTDHAMLIGKEKSDTVQKMDLRMDIDKVHFKSSIQHENDTNAFFEENAARESLNMAAGIGYKWNLLDQKLSLIPIMGLSYHGKSQDFKSTAPYDNNDKFFQKDTKLSEWNSWWFGVDLRAKPNPDLSLESSLLFHSAKFSEKETDQLGLTEALRTCEGEGRVFKFGLRQQISSSWSAGILYSWQQWMVEKGEFETDFSSKTKGNLPFNENIQELNISLSYDF